MGIFGVGALDWVLIGPIAEIPLAIAAGVRFDNPKPPDSRRGNR